MRAPLTKKSGQARGLLHVQPYCSVPDTLVQGGNREKALIIRIFMSGCIEFPKNEMLMQFVRRTK